MKPLKEPLLHFLLIGAALFALHTLSNPDPGASSDRRIVVTAGRVDQLVRIFAKTWQRSPTPNELRGLIDDFVLEEAYYRQAVAMGIDQNDTVIRRRLRQKMEFLTEDAAALTEATEEDLATFLAVHEDRFTTDPIYTFRQVYFNPERHGDDPEKHAGLMAEKLRFGETVDGDRTLLPDVFEEASRRAVDGSFGTGFAKKLDPLTVGEWSDPIRSGLGLHLVRIDSRTPGRLPALDEIRPLVEREWANERRLDLRKRFNEELLADYEVAVEWPGTSDQSATEK